MRTVISFLSKFVFAFTVAFFFYGIVRFPDSPIQPCGEALYCGKQGQSRTPEDFRAYKQWKTVNMIAFPLMFLLILANKRIEKKGGELDNTGRE
ncbi:MAG: hypothetical protein IT174_04945 [Acidobacteria bacterium]|nr:hypothetical protein [Acidobacteriota bacterium]